MTMFWTNKQLVVTCLQANETLPKHRPLQAVCKPQ